MVELVDTLDLKSNGHCVRAGSSPAPSTEPDFLDLFLELPVFLCSKSIAMLGM